MAKRKNNRTSTGSYLSCDCGAKAMVYQSGESRWFSHCPGCGRLAFFSSAQVFERLKAGGKLCPHKPELVQCKDGKSKTSWCGACRVRVFVPMV